MDRNYLKGPPSATATVGGVPSLGIRHEGQLPSGKMLTLRETTIRMLLESAVPTPVASAMGMPVMGSMVKPVDDVPDVAKRRR